MQHKYYLLLTRRQTKKIDRGSWAIMKQLWQHTVFHSHLIFIWKYSESHSHITTAINAYYRCQTARKNDWMHVYKSKMRKHVLLWLAEERKSYIFQGKRFYITYKQQPSPSSIICAKGYLFFNQKQAGYTWKLKNVFISKEAHNNATKLFCYTNVSFLLKITVLLSFLCV